MDIKFFVSNTWSKEVFCQVTHPKNKNPQAKTQGHTLECETNHTTCFPSPKPHDTPQQYSKEDAHDSEHPYLSLIHI